MITSTVPVTATPGACRDVFAPGRDTGLRTGPG
jgi:hypothetical protein